MRVSTPCSLVNSPPKAQSMSHVTQISPRLPPPDHQQRDSSLQATPIRGSSPSDVDRRGLDRRPSAHARESPHLYSGTRPNSLYGGPPPRLALVASVLSEIGKPAAVKAAAVAVRRRRISGLSGTGLTICLARVSADECQHLRASRYLRLHPD
jgi:hypothetical protein